MTRRKLLVGALAIPALSFAGEEYKLGPDSERQADVPQGQISKFSWSSKLYAGTVRSYWIYVPAQYKPDKPACVMIFQDGAGFVSEKGSWRVPIVFDNLIDKSEMPVTIGIFIDPGIRPAPSPDAQAQYDRSFEYDTVDAWYSQFLINEILPEIRKNYNLSKDPNDYAIGGSSSGGIAAFTVAWNRPDVFRRVLSFIGSYTDLRGGNNYPALIRKSEPLPLPHISAGRHAR